MWKSTACLPSSPAPPTTILRVLALGRIGDGKNPAEHLLRPVQLYYIWDLTLPHGLSSPHTTRALKSTNLPGEGVGRPEMEAASVMHSPTPLLLSLKSSLFFYQITSTTFLFYFFFFEIRGGVEVYLN